MKKLDDGCETEGRWLRRRRPMQIARINCMGKQRCEEARRGEGKKGRKGDEKQEEEL